MSQKCKINPLGGKPLDSTWNKVIIVHSSDKTVTCKACGATIFKRIDKVKIHLKKCIGEYAHESESSSSSPQSNISINEPPPNSSPSISSDGNDRAIISAPASLTEIIDNDKEAELQPISTFSSSSQIPVSQSPVASNK